MSPVKRTRELRVQNESLCVAHAVPSVHKQYTDCWSADVSPFHKTGCAQDLQPPQHAYSPQVLALLYNQKHLDALWKNTSRLFHLELYTTSVISIVSSKLCSQLSFNYNMVINDNNGECLLSVVQWALC
jgi:hypothetical protein